MVIAPLVGHTAFKDHCLDCGHTTDFWMERGVLDVPKKTLTLYFYCKTCCDKHSGGENWKRVVVCPVPL